MKPRVTIIICTKDRADSLEATLNSIRKSAIPPDLPTELVIVDNGSIDHTAQVVQSSRSSKMPIRLVVEQAPGKGQAFNTGISTAAGEIMLCTDDDIRVPLNWIEGMCRPILDGVADAVAGGVIFPHYIADALARPPYSSRRSWFASTEELDREAPARMVGANMAFHRQVLDRVPRFDLELGPGALGFYDETLFSLQLMAAGYKLAGAFDIMVEHHFDLTRLTRKGMIDLARKMGRSHAFVFHHWEHQKSRLAFPRLVLSHLRRNWIRCCDRIDGNAACVVSLPALKAEQDLAFYREYIAQRRRPYKYPSRSLASSVTRTALLSN